MMNGMKLTETCDIATKKLFGEFQVSVEKSCWNWRPL